MEIQALSCLEGLRIYPCFFIFCVYVWILERQGGHFLFCLMHVLKNHGNLVRTVNIVFIKWSLSHCFLLMEEQSGGHRQK
jgi:hypothetical protein